MRKRLVYLALTALFVLASAGCAVRRQAALESDGAYAPEPTPAGGATEAERSAGNASTPSQQERLIIRTGSLTLIVEDPEGALGEVEDIAGDLGGYVVESNVSRYDEGAQATVTLRVPAEDFSTALDRIRDLAVEVRNSSTSADDVTEEYVDLQSRQLHLEATEDRLLDFLEEAEDTEAALTVFEQLEQIQMELEQVKGKIQYLEQSAAMATIRVSLTPDELAQPIEIGRWRPAGTAREAFEGLLNVLQFLVDAAIYLFVLILPTVLLIAAPFAALFFVVRAIVRRRRKAKQQEE